MDQKEETASVRENTVKPICGTPSVPLLVVEVAVAADDVRAARPVVHVYVDLGLNLVVHSSRLVSSKDPAEHAKELQNY